MDHFNISKAKILRDELINELELYLEQKKINFIKTQPKSPIMKDIIEGKSDGFSITDKFSHYVIKDEQIDNNIYTLQLEINALEKYIIKEMQRINNAGGSYIVRYYRDIEKLSWRKISKKMHYSERQCQRLYNGK